MLMFLIIRGNDFRPVWTAGHSRFWQSGRPLHCVIQLCQQLGFVSGQSECSAGYAKHEADLAYQLLQDNPDIAKLIIATLQKKSS